MSITPTTSSIIHQPRRESFYVPFSTSVLAAAYQCGHGGLAFGAARLNASTPQIRLELPTEPQPASGTIDLPIRIAGAVNLGAWEFDLVYDPALLSVQGLTINPTFGAEFDCNVQSQRCTISLGPILDTPGTANMQKLKKLTPCDYQRTRHRQHAGLPLSHSQLQ